MHLRDRKHLRPFEIPTPGRRTVVRKLQLDPNLTLKRAVGQGWVSRSLIVSKNLRSICDKHTMMLRLEKRVTGMDRKALVS